MGKRLAVEIMVFVLLYVLNILQLKTNFYNVGI